MDSKGNIGKYDGPDELAHVYSFCLTLGEAEKMAAWLNRENETRWGKFVAGSFKAVIPEGRMPAVVGTLTGNPSDYHGYRKAVRKEVA